MPDRDFVKRSGLREKRDFISLRTLEVSHSIQQEVNVMPKCPECGTEMIAKKTKKGDQFYVCKQHGAFIPNSIFGVT
jgi:predicted RNA-binding Zn-ribbon protein involved in translation (DUF1610 family)